MGNNSSNNFILDYGNLFVGGQCDDGKHEGE